MCDMNNLLACYFVPHPPLIVPEIGHGQEQAIQKTIDAYKEVARQIAAFAPDTIIFISPHATTYQDYYRIEKSKSCRGNFKDFQAPNVTFDVQQDVEFINALERNTLNDSFPAGTKGVQNTPLDHGVMVPLYFINAAYQNFKVVRLSYSGLPYPSQYEYGMIIQKTIAQTPGKRYVVVASGDLSHMLKEDGPYGYAKEGPIFDKNVCEILTSGNFIDLFSIDAVLIGKAGECGFRSLLVMTGILDGLAITPTLLSYEGPFGVGYAVASFKVDGKNETRNFGEQWKAISTSTISRRRKNEDPYIALARRSLEHYVKTGTVLKLDKYPNGIAKERAGVFVSLHSDGMLRGCIGTILPTTDSIAEEIIRNAVAAGMEDPRFPSVETHELPNLVYSVDILKTPEPISSPSELDVKKYGVIVKYRGRKGLLLPNIDGIDSVHEQIEIARNKGGIKEDDPYTLERFEVVRHE